jgi:hypothetical protein
MLISSLQLLPKRSLIMIVIFFASDEGLAAK